jgi:transposase
MQPVNRDFNPLMSLKLSCADLEHLTPERVRTLDCTQKEQLLTHALEDLRELHDRLNQNPWNSSQSPSSQPIWARVGRPEEGKAEQEGPSASPGENGGELAEQNLSAEPTEESKGPAASESSGKGKGKPKKPGRRAGMAGHSRHQNLPVTREVKHFPASCGGCGQSLSEAHFVAEQGHLSVDVERREVEGALFGLQAIHVKHLYGTASCPTWGHVHQREPGRAPAEVDWNVALTEWHLVGPLLVSLIVFLHLRMRLSYRRIQEFLEVWLGLSLSTSTLTHCVHEAGRAVEPLEESLIEEVKQAALVHVDETGWKEGAEVLWLWCFVTLHTCLYLIGYRNREFLEIVLGELFLGWLMSDGYWAYRDSPKRLRCWAHLIRKARGLAESRNTGEAKPFGKAVLVLFADLMAGIYAAREGPPEQSLRERFAARLATFKELCLQYSEAAHEKTRALAREFLNDWDAMGTVLDHPELPLTNNTAERALRHWVIARLLSQGTRTPQGTRAFGLLASVIDTCRLRQVNPWPYLAEVMAKRRQGEPAPPLPAPALS